MDKLLHNPHLTFLDDAFGYTGESRVYAGRDLTERDFKKWYNHVWERNKFNSYLIILAHYEDEDGLHELANYWGMQEMQNDPHIPF